MSGRRGRDGMIYMEAAVGGSSGHLDASILPSWASLRPGSLPDSVENTFGAPP